MVALRQDAPAPAAPLAPADPAWRHLVAIVRVVAETRARQLATGQQQ